MRLIPRVTSKAGNLALVAVAQVLALALWFSGTAAGPDMARESGAIGPGFQALLTGAVQAGFVVGTLASSVLGLADRYDPRRVFAAAAVAGAAANAAVFFMPIGAPVVIAARFITGAALAGVDPGAGLDQTNDGGHAVTEAEPWLGQPTLANQVVIMLSRLDGGGVANTRDPAIQAAVRRARPNPGPDTQPTACCPISSYRREESIGGVDSTAKSIAPSSSARVST